MSRPKKSENPDAIYAEIGKRLQKARTRLGLSQDALAQRVGLTRTSITNIERGRQRILVDALYGFATVLGIPILELLPERTPESTSIARAVGEIRDEKSRDFVSTVLRLPSEQP